MPIDAHCHLADPRLAAHLDEIINESRRSGVSAWVQGGVDPADWQRQLGLRARFGSGVVPVFGLHPWWVAAHSFEESQAALVELRKMLPQALALGELGLDSMDRFDGTLAVQTQVFETQLRIALEYNLPIVLHVVKAHSQAIEILRRVGVSSRGGIVHSFSGAWADAREYLDLGLSISVGGTLTRKGYKGLKETVAQAPLNRLVLESDSPDQRPENWGSDLNRPVSLLVVAQAMAAIRGVSVDEIFRSSDLEIQRVFGVSLCD